MRPLIVATPWASTTNYPAGGSAWSGQLLKVAPAQTYFTPATGASAEEMNYLIGRVETAVKGVADAAGQQGAMCWPSGPQRPITSADHTVACFDAKTARFYAFQWNSSGPLSGAVYSEDGGFSWLQAGSNTNFANTRPLAIASRPDGRAVIATGENTFYGDPHTGGAWTASATVNGNFAAAWTSGSIAALGSLFIGGWNTGSAGVLRSSTDGNTWTTRTGLAALISGSNDKVYVVAGPSSALVFVNTNGQSTYLYTTDGATYTNKTMGSFAAGDSFVGAVYEPVEGAFYVLSYRSATNTAKVFKSTDGGLTFGTPVVLPSNYQPGNQLLEACGHAIATLGAGALVVPVYDAVGTRGRRLLLSVDGGTSWNFAPNWRNTSSIATEADNIAGSGDQLVTWSRSHMSVSAAGGKGYPVT